MNDKIIKCEMCDKYPAATHRWYQYDNGEQFKAVVCPICAMQHDLLVKASS